MSATVESLGIDRMSVSERLELIEQIWNSLPETVDPIDVPAWQLAELAKRRDDAAANPGVGRHWREVVNQLGRVQ